MKDFDYSVVIPAYRVNESILETIHSIEVQLIKPKEIIVVNDGCDPVLVTILENKNLRIVNKHTPSGPSQAKQKGVEEVKTEFFAILDGDDLWGEDFIEKQAKLWRNVNQDCAVIGGSFNAFGSSSARYFNQTNLKTAKKSKKVSIEELCFRNPFTASSVVFRTESIKRVGGWSHFENCSDYATYAKLALAGFDLYFSVELAGSYRIHDKQVSRNISNQYHGDLQVFNFLNDLSEMSLTKHQKRAQYRKIWFRAVARVSVYELGINEIPKPDNSSNKIILFFLPSTCKCLLLENN